MSRTLQAERMSHHTDVVLSPRSLYRHSRIPEMTFSDVAKLSIDNTYTDVIKKGNKIIHDNFFGPKM